MMRLKALLRLLCLLAGLFLTACGIASGLFSNLSLAVLLPLMMGSLLLVIAILWHPLGRLCRHGIFKALKIVVIGGYCLYLVMFLTALPFMLQGALHTPSPDADAVIVLGAGFRNNIPSVTLRYRLETALTYALDNPDTLVVVSGGQGPDEPCPEAEVMGNWLTDHGLHPDRILYEKASTSTAENFRFSAEVYREATGSDPEACLYVTNTFHVYRAGRIAAREGVRAEGLAAPEVSWLSVNNWMREALAIWYHWIFGRSAMA